MGCVSGVAVKSSFHIFMVLSASQLTSLDPLTSYDRAYMHASLSSDPENGGDTSNEHDHFKSYAFLQT